MARNSVVVDANIWIAALDINDSTHGRAVQALRDVTKKKMQVLTNTFVLQEAMTIIARNISREDASAFYSSIREQPQLYILDESLFWLEEAVDFVKERKRIATLSYVDYTLIVLARSMGAELLTFDKKLLSAYRQIA